jgi:photosystem II stability/assembly factor-like uncharacterized protein
MCFRSIIDCGGTLLAGASPVIPDGSVGLTASTNGGSSWESVDPGLKYMKVQALIAVGTRLLAGTWGEGVYVSTDEGTNWTPSNNGLTCTEVNALIVNGSSIFAGTDGGVFRSTDNGTSWTRTCSGITKVWISALSAEGDIIYAGTEKDGVFFSTDNGSVWNQIAAGLTCDRIHSLAVSGDAVFAGTDSMGVFRLSTNSSNWTPVGKGTIQDGPILDITVVGTSIFAESSTDVFRSTNNGEQWTTIKANLPTGAGTAFVSAGGKIFAGGQDGMYCSDDNGASWSGCGLSGKTIKSLAAVDNAIFAGTYLNGVFKSVDNGKNWTESTPGWAYSIEDLITVGGNIFGISSTSVFLSTNKGKTWENVHSGIDSKMLISLGRSNSSLYVGTRYDGLWQRPLSDLVDVTTLRPAGKRIQQPLTVSTSGEAGSPLIFTVTLPEPEDVFLDLFELSGKKVTSLLDRKLPRGCHSFTWDPKNVASGNYTVIMRAGPDACNRPLTILH